MKERKIEGTYCESAKTEEWYGHYYECNECGQIFMLNEDSEKCFCPGCGRFIVWNEAENE